MIIWLFLIAYSAFSQDCPPESMAVDYVSPVTKTRRITCGYMKNGSIVKHGAEKEFNARGSVIKQTFYNHGKEGEVPKFEPKKQVKAESKSSAPMNEMDATFEMIKNLMKILTFSKQGINEGRFKVYRCDSDPKTWVRAALTSQAVQKTYTFNDHCDVKGTFVASFLEEFPVEFELRNLDGYNHTKMKVKMTVKQKKDSILYRFEVKEGVITSSLKKMEFVVDYELHLDPVTGEGKRDSQKGKVTLLKANETPVNVTRPLVFDL